MRRIAPLLLIMVLSLSLGLVYVPSGTYAAERRPYVKTYGSDVMTGGWFNEGGTCDTATVSKYQDGSNSPDNITGGIMTYTRSTPSSGGLNSVGGSSSQFAAYVLGLVDGNNSQNYGFYSNGAGGGAVAGRTFANDTRTPWGGLFQDDQADGIRQSYCIPDYYSKKPNPNPPGLPGGLLTSATASGKYYGDGTTAPFVLNNTNVVFNPSSATGKNITVFVNGDVYIGGNITYDETNPAATVKNIPKFAVVARGNIYIGPNVTNLYGFYIAQPDPANINAVTEEEGVIWTCHENNKLPVLYTWPAANCNQKLTITGGMAAKQFNLLRINGTADTASGEDGLAGIGSGNIAEVVNYSPAMPLGGPFFTTPDASTIRNKIDSLISLPPVF